jgi:hypothetical protein
MPLWLRKFTFLKLKNWFDEQDTQTKNEESWTKGQHRKEAAKNKNIKPPTYVTKASKK